MADFSLRDLWWLRPAGPDNPLPALQLGAQIAQNKAAMDLRERDLANDIARTSLMRGEMLAKQKIQTSIIEGQAAQAAAIASITDWTNPEQTRRIAEVGMRYPITVGNKAWLGAQLMERNALEAKQKATTDRGVSESVTIGFDEAGNPITENFVRFGNRVFRSTQHEIVEDPKTKRRFMKSGTGALHPLDTDAADVSINPQTGQQFVQALPILDSSGRQVGIGYRGSKGNIIRLPPAQLSEGQSKAYENELKALENQEKDAIKAAPSDAPSLRRLYLLKQRELHQKFYGPSETAPVVQREGLRTAPPTPPPVSPANPAGKVRVIAPDGTPGFIPASQLEEALKAGYKQP